MVGQRDLARRHPRPAADHRRVGQRVVRRPHRRVAGGGASIGPSPATDATIVAASACGVVERRQQAGDRPREEGLADPGGPTSSRPWPPASAISSARRASSWPRTSARSGRASRRTRRAVDRWRGPPRPPPAGSASSTRGGAGRVERRGAPRGPRRRPRAASRTPTTSMPPTRRASSHGVGRDDRRGRRRAGPARRPSAGCPAPVETSPPSDSSPTSASRPGRGDDLLRAEQDPHRDREVERRTGLAQVGRSEVDRDPAGRVD